MAKGKDEEFMGFTWKDMDRMVKSLNTNKATLKRYIRDLGLQHLTVNAAVKAIRYYRGR